MIDYQDFVPPTVVQFLVILAVTVTPSLAWLGYNKLRKLLAARGARNAAID